jgi:hypothetical protein
VRYAVPPDSLATVLLAVLARRRLTLVEGPTGDSTTAVAIAESPMSLFSYGEYVRVLAQSRPGQPSMVRVAARSRYLLDASGRVDRVAPRLFQAFDSALGPSAVGPYTGDRIRGRTTAGGPRVTGQVTDAQDGVPWLMPDDGGPGTPVADLRDLAIDRGRYSHRGEGATIGALLGRVAGVVVTQSASDPNPYAGQAVFAGVVIGGLAGFVVGHAFQTTVWSEIR